MEEDMEEDMEERRSKLGVLKTAFAIRFIKLSLIYMIALVVFNMCSSWLTAVELKECLILSSPLKSSYIISQLSFTGAIIVLIGVLFVLLHRSLGALPRIEQALLKVIGGDYSLRISVRKQDAVSSLVEKLNKILDLLENKTKV